MPEINFYITGIKEPLSANLEKALKTFGDYPVRFGKIPESERKNPGTFNIVISAGQHQGADLKQIKIKSLANMPDSKNDPEYFEMPVRVGAVVDHIGKMIRSAKEMEQYPLSIDLAGYEFLPRKDILVNKSNGSETRLTDKERDILLALYHNGKDTMDKKTLLHRVWGFADGVETHTLETHIYRLRRKMEPDPAEPVYVVTLDNGYKLNCRMDAG